MDPDPYHFMRIRILDPVFYIWIRIQGNDMDSTDPDPPHWCGGSIFFCQSRIRTFSSDPGSGSGSEKGPVRNQIKSRILYPYPNFKVSNLPDSNKTPLFYLRLRSENLLLITKLLLYSLAPMPLPPLPFCWNNCSL